MGMLASVSESQPHENDKYNIYHKRYDGNVVVPPHSVGFPSMYQAKECRSGCEEMKVTEALRRSPNVSSC